MTSMLLNLMDRVFFGLLVKHDIIKDSFSFETPFFFFF